MTSSNDFLKYLKDNHTYYLSLIKCSALKKTFSNTKNKIYLIPVGEAIDEIKNSKSISDEDFNDDFDNSKIDDIIYTLILNGNTKSSDAILNLKPLYCLTGEIEIPDGTDITRVDILDNLCCFTINKLPIFKKLTDSSENNVNKFNEDIVTGGADYKNTDRKGLWELAFEFSNIQNNDVCMEIIIAMHDYANNNGYKNEALVIASLAGYDTLTSLYIMLQPNKSKKSKLYLSDKFIKNFTVAMDTHEMKYTRYVYVILKQETPTDAYERIRSTCYVHNSVVDNIVGDSAIRVTKENIISTIKSCYEKIASADLPELRNCISFSEKYAEAELRIMAAIFNNNNPILNNNNVINQLSKLYSSATLDEPYVLKNNVPITSNSFYYSVLHLLLHSECIFFFPNHTSKSSIDDLYTNGVTECSIDYTFMKYNSHKRDVSDRLHKNRNRKEI